MSAHDANVRAIVDYFESGIKPADDAPRLGVELEHIIVDENSQPVSYSEEHGVHWILQQLAASYPELTYDAEGDLLGVARPGKSITIEPAAQLELSAGPFENVGEIRVEFELFQRELFKLLAPVHRRAYAIGYHPTARAEDLELIPKSRYRQMDAHYAKIGGTGRNMMRGSAATQISIDYYSVEDCLRKLRLAGALTPLFALLCDNAPVFEGAPREHHAVRTYIWRHCDPARCGIVPGSLSSDFTLERYAEYVLRTPAIFQVETDGSYTATDKSFDELFADTAMDRSQVEHALSLLFNDVRLKTYLEIRPADSMPIPFVAGYAALIKGLFYNADNLNKLDEMFSGVTEEAVDQAKTDIMALGYDAKTYGKPVGETLEELVSMAHDALAPNERNYLSPLEQMTRTHMSLAMRASR